MPGGGRHCLPKHIRCQLHTVDASNKSNGMNDSPRNHPIKAFSRASENDLLSIDLLQEVCGNEDLETVEEVEIIFNAIAEINALDRCINLRSLSDWCRVETYFQFAMCWSLPRALISIRECYHQKLKTYTCPT